MDSDSQARRQELWRRLVLEGEDHQTVVSELATEYDVDEETITADLTTMDTWLSDLYRSGAARDVSQLIELQENRQGLHQMASEAQERGDLALELKIRKELARTINREKKLGEDVKLGVEKTDYEKMLDDMGF